MNRPEKRMISQRTMAIGGLFFTLLIVLAFFAISQNRRNDTASSNKDSDIVSNVSTSVLPIQDNNADTTVDDTQSEAQNSSTNPTAENTSSNNQPTTNTPEENSSNTSPTLPEDEFTSAVKDLYPWDGTRSAKTFEIFDCADGPSGIFSRPKLSISGYQIQTTTMNSIEYKTLNVLEFLANLGWIPDECNFTDTPGYIYAMAKDGKTVLVEELPGDGDNSWKVKISYEH